MKTGFILGLFLLTTTCLLAQEVSSDSQIKDDILKNLSSEQIAKNEILAKQLTELDQRLVAIDQKIQKESNSTKKVESLVERVQILEKKDVTVIENVISTYDHNYKAAIINLIFMDRELKPLILFKASKDFFASLSDISNPMTYAGYQQWFTKFKEYMDKNKNNDATLAMLSNVLSVTGDVGKSLPLAGPLANTLLSSINTFIGSIGKKETAFRTESQKMFELTAILSQFTHERDLIENEWDEINKELDELQQAHNESIDHNLTLLNIERPIFNHKFTNEQDANKRFEFVKVITDSISVKVKAEHKNNPDKWKTTFYQQMQTVQSLKVRFGTLTFRIKENINKYGALIERYKNINSPEVKTKMSELQVKLQNLNNAFDATFSPQAYIKSASTMYIVE